MPKSTSLRNIASGAIGNTLEWYDFAIYGYFATSIGRLFFPKEDSVAQVLAAFGIFAIGYVMRPLGGVIIGYIGDRVSRRAALNVSIVAMASSTFVIGVLPGYATIGVAAPILLTACRMLQGLSVGGEYTTSLVFMVENAPRNRRGFNGALGCCGAVLGILLGSATGALLAAFMSAEDLETWGWRIPFILGLVIGLAGIVLRRHVDDASKPIADPENPLLETLKTQRTVVVQIMALTASNAIPFYLLFVYIVSWLELVNKMPPEKSLVINTVSMVALIPIQLIAGSISDRIGRKPVLIAASVAAIVFSIPLFHGMYQQSMVMIQLSQLCFAIIAGTYLGVMPAFMVELPSPQVRSTTIALGYNLTAGVIGGFTPFAAAWLIHRTRDDISPAYILMAAAAISLAAILSMKESYRKSL
jgi:MHS family proline/betaine transporter-like MFS transporter